MLMGKIL